MHKVCSRRRAKQAYGQGQVTYRERHEKLHGCLEEVESTCRSYRNDEEKGTEISEDSLKRFESTSASVTVSPAFVGWLCESFDKGVCRSVERDSAEKLEVRLNYDDAKTHDDEIEEHFNRRGRALACHIHYRQIDLEMRKKGIHHLKWAKMV